MRIASYVMRIDVNSHAERVRHAGNEGIKSPSRRAAPPPMPHASRGDADDPSSKAGIAAQRKASASKTSETAISAP